jgi:hypothetical protein
MYNFQKTRTRKGKPLSLKEKKHRNKIDYKCKAKHYKQFSIKIRKDKYQDVIDHLLQQESLVNYIISLVKKEIKGE